MAVRYDTATSCDPGYARSGTVAIRNHWINVTGLGHQGIYNCRRIRGSATAYSIHAEGRAVDLKANADLPREHDLAERYVHFLIANAEKLQIQMIIWNRRSWRDSRGWRGYNGASPHTDHAHVEQNRTGAAQVTKALLDELWGQPTQEEPVYLDIIRALWRMKQNKPTAELPADHEIHWAKSLLTNEMGPEWVVNVAAHDYGQPAVF